MFSKTSPPHIMRSQFKQSFQVEKLDLEEMCLRLYLLLDHFPLTVIIYAIKRQFFIQVKLSSGNNVCLRACVISLSPRMNESNDLGVAYFVHGSHTGISKIFPLARCRKSPLSPSSTTQEYSCRCSKIKVFKYLNEKTKQNSRYG